MSGCCDDKPPSRLPLLFLGVAVVIALLVIVIASSGCRPAAMPLPANHPARVDAPTGRLAGPPAAFDTAPPPTDEPPPAAPSHDGHH